MLKYQKNITGIVMNKIVKTGLYFLYTTASALTASTIGIILDPAPQHVDICDESGCYDDFVPSPTAAGMAIGTYTAPH